MTGEFVRTLSRWKTRRWTGASPRVGRWESPLVEVYGPVGRQFFRKTTIAVAFVHARIRERAARLRRSQQPASKACSRFPPAHEKRNVAAQPQVTVQIQLYLHQALQPACRLIPLAGGERSRRHGLHLMYFVCWNASFIAAWTRCMCVISIIPLPAAIDENPPRNDW